MRNRPLLLGHRGARSVSEIPENTLASFDVALKKGADGFEFDVRLTRDGIPVIFHDPAFHRKAVSSLSHEQLLALAADEGGPAGRFPTLGQVVRGYGHVFLDIELKVPDCEALVLDAL